MTFDSIQGELKRQMRETKDPCAICGQSERVAIHQLAPLGHAYVPVIADANLDSGLQS